MATYLLYIRLGVALIALAALLAGALADTPWLVWAGIVAGTVAEVTGILQARVRFESALEHTFRGGAEWLPALGVAAFEPYALMLVIPVVLYALFASGMQTVAHARGTHLTSNSGESLRRLMTSVGGLAVLSIPLAGLGVFDFAAWAGTTPKALCVTAGAVALLGGMRALLDMLISVKEVSGVPGGVKARNVDT